MPSEYYNLDPGSSDNILEKDVNVRKPKKLSARNVIIAVIALVCVIGLALGLGLSQGLKNTREPPKADTCATFTEPKSRPQARPHRSGARWLEQQECTIPDGQQCPNNKGEIPPLILISLDGFRAEYLTRNITPVLSKLADCGVTTPSMRPAFPSKTFPNHYAIATGMYPESHGIIDNFMYDKVMKKTFTLAGEEKNDPAWWHGEPIWNTVTKQNKTAGTIFWPGTEAPIQDIRPAYCYVYDQSVPFEDRVDRALSWLDLPAESRPDFITLYFHQPDSAGHDFGPYAKVNGNITYVDNVIGQLMDGLMLRGLDKCTNIILVSDHGMTIVDCGRIVRVNDIIDSTQLFFYDGVMGRVTGDYRFDGEGNIVEQEGASPAEILDKLKCGAYNNTKDWYTRAQLKEDLPARLHYRVSPRIEDVIVKVQDEWLLSGSGFLDVCYGGDHGYDNTFDSMQAIFMAYGPSLKQNQVTETFENIELYNFMTELLDLEAAPNNGTKGSLSHLLRTPEPISGLPSGIAYSECPYPGKDEITDRRNASDCSCGSWSDLTNSTVDEVDSRLNLTSGIIDDITTQHLPLGIPLINRDDITVCRLTQQDYINGYSSQTYMPLWSSSYIKKSRKPNNLEEACVRADVRLSVSEAAQCSQYIDDARDITWSHLFPSDFSSDNELALDTLISSNLVPMYKGFKNGVWQYVTDLLKEYNIKYGDLLVSSGPVFDYNYDGVADDVSTITNKVGEGPVPLPSHFYIQLLRCDEGQVQTCTGTLHTMSVLIPHKPELDYCQTYEISSYYKYLQDHVVRVRDVELVTGLQFYPDLDPAVRVKLVTYLQLGLWKRISWMDPQACPDVSTPVCPSGYSPDKIPLLLISLDGFRHDYIERKLTPTLEKLSYCGVHAPYMRSIYPSLTFPNHYSIATGLYPDFHGIVDNSMYDIGLNLSFYLGSPDSYNTSWWHGEPVWNTVEKAGLHAVTVFWPGSDVAIQDMHPTEYYIYNGDIPYNYRVDQILKWLNGSAGIYPDLLVLYMDKVDKMGHEGGPVSVQVDEALEYVDKRLDELMDGIKAAGMESCINIIITSDHGMTDISCPESVLLKDYLDDEDFDKTYVYQGGSGRIGNTYRRSGNFYYAVPVPDRVPVKSLVDKMNCKNDYMSVYANADFPVRFHYASSPRTEQIQIKLRDRWQVNRFSPWCPILGQHGWDQSFDTMKAFFLAYGPSFKDSYQVEQFDNIEVYNVITELFGLQGAPNNGTKGSLDDIFRQTPNLPEIGGSTNYDSCPFPTDDNVYNERSNNTDCTCDLSRDQIRQADNRLNQNEAEQEALVRQHVPQGLPAFMEESLCLLHQQDYLTGFSENLSMPLWTAFTLNENQLQDGLLNNCLRPDVRLESENLLTCQDLNNLGEQYSYQFLFPPELSSTNGSVPDTAILTNVVPMLKSFVSNVWKPVIEQIKTWSRQHNSIHVQLGPVFDSNADAVADTLPLILQQNTSVAIPTHFYLTVLWCSTSDCSNMDYNILSFILPHNANISNCMDFEEYLYDNRVRLRDIELVTNLQMLTASNTIEAIKTRVRFPEDVAK